MGSAASAVAARECAERARLEHTHALAEIEFDTARATIRERIGKSSKEEYRALDHTVNQAWDQLQRARKAVDAHIRQHGCGISETVNLLDEKPSW